MKIINRKLSALLAVLLVLALGGCAAPAPASSTPAAPPTSAAPAAPPASASEAPAAGAVPGLSAANYPRVDGSTANLPLMAEVYSAVCAVSPEAGEAMAQASGTADAWIALAEGHTDLLMVYEAPASTVQKLAEYSNVKLETTPLGRDGLVFLVNGKNPTSGLTQQQLRDIYTGKVTDWSKVGGAAQAIAPFQRNEDSGSQTMFLKLLMKETPPMKAPTQLISGAMGALIDSVAAFDGGAGAIGYSVYYYAQEMYKNPDLKLLSVDGIAPTNQTIGDGSYPLVNEFFVAIRADEPKDSPARLLRDWLLTDAGREALVKAGYVAIG